MNSRKNPWLINGALAIGLALIALVMTGQLKSSAHAAGTGWETDGMLVNTLDGETDRVVLIDTNRKNIAVYKLQGSGQFRLIGARDCRYDLMLEDTSKIPEIEQKHGITAQRAAELWEMHKNSQLP